jgi:glycosyltransferase involved in cell wall biosynthesis
MKVALVARSVFPLHGYGGLERHVYDLARALADRDVRVTLITRPPARGREWNRSAIHEAVTAEFVPYRTFPFAGRRGTTVLDRSTAYPLFGLRAGQRALELVRRGEADIVHGLGGSVLGYARERASAGAPLVLNPQGLEEFGATDPSRARLKRALYLPLRRAVLACAAAADAVIATDRTLEPVVRRHLKIDASKVHTIPNALDLASIDALVDPALAGELRRRHEIAGDEIVLLSAGRLEENKGLQVLLRSLAALREHGGGLEGRPWRWVSIGDGPYRDRLEALARELSLTDRVRFHGRVSDAEMHAWYEIATLFVHPTLYEGSSLVTLEAMAHRRAVVASSAGGLPDKVRPGVNGWLVPPGETGALAAAISGAVSDAARLERYGREGRVIVEREFSWRTAGDATVALYELLLATARSPDRAHR